MSDPLERLRSVLFPTRRYIAGPIDEVVLDDDEPVPLATILDALAVAGVDPATVELRPMMPYYDTTAIAIALRAAPPSPEQDTP